MRELKNEKIYIKEWKEDVFIRPITVKEQMEIEKGTPEENLGKLLQTSIVNEAGEPIFQSMEEALNLPAKIGQRLYLTSLKVSGIRKKDYDEMVKNLDSVQQD